MSTRRTSKYVGKVFDNQWSCKQIELAYVQGKSAKWSGHRTYKYVFTRPTSDGKAEKSLCLNCRQAAAVYAGRVSVEELAHKYAAKANIYGVGYYFYKAARQ